MAKGTNLTGVWVGNYFQNDHPSPISAAIAHEGESLTGSMTDGAPDRAISVFEAAAQMGLPPGSDEQIEANLRARFPDEPAAPIRYVTLLPSGSTLNGRVAGDTVEFLKTYQGVHVGGFQVGDRLVGHQIDSHRVHYQGKVSPDGAEIEGKWWIDSLADPPVRQTEGWFTLRRQED